MSERRLGVLLLGFLLSIGGLFGGLLAYYAIGLACGGTDVSEPSDHAFCDLYPSGGKLLWAVGAIAPLVGGASGRPRWLLVGAAAAAGALVLMLAVFAAV